MAAGNYALITAGADIHDHILLILIERYQIRLIVFFAHRGVNPFGVEQRKLVHLGR